VKYTRWKSVAERCLLGTVLSGIGGLCFGLMGCGDHSSGPPANSATTRAAIAGIVRAPASQMRPASARRRPTSALEPVPNALVTLTNLDTGALVATTSTDAQGSYAFPQAQDGVNYQVTATAQTPNGTLTESALLTPPMSDEPILRDLDPASTLAAAAALKQYRGWKETTSATSGPTAVGSLQALADELEQNLKQKSVPAPDLTRQGTLLAASTRLLTDNRARGAYAGDLDGEDSAGKLAVLVAGGRFRLVVIPDPRADEGALSASRRSAEGTVSASGVLIARAGGNLQVSGMLIGDVGSGVWSDGAHRGTWKVARLTRADAGLYEGTFTRPGTLQEENGGRVAAIIQDDGSLYIQAGNGRDAETSLFGKGSIDAYGHILFFFLDSAGGMGTGTGQLTADGYVSGSYTTSARVKRYWHVKHQTTLPPSRSARPLAQQRRTTPASS